MFPAHRPSGVTPIGILNIVFGALGTVAAALLFALGGVAATAGSTWEAQESAQIAGGQHTGAPHTGKTWEAPGETSGVGTAVATTGSRVMIEGVTKLACWFTLLVSGIGVLKLAPWGRTLSLASGVAGLFLQGTWLFLGGFNIFSAIFSLVVMGYCGLLVYLFTRPDWKAAFAGAGGGTFTGTTTTSPHTSSDQRFRHAA